MNFARAILALGLLLTTAAPASSEVPKEKSKSTRPRIALVLEGGGALGFAHVGVLKILEEQRIPVDFIVGTSMGSIVGAGYASGRTTAELEEVITKTDWDQLFNESPPREMVHYRLKSGRESELYGDGKIGLKDGGVVIPAAMVQGQYVEYVFQDLYGKVPPELSFDDLPIPYRAVAADLITGQAVIIDRGNLALAARASMSVPGFFSPVEAGGKVLVDGGIANNFPVDIALERGAEHIIAVQFQTGQPTKDDLSNPLSISGQVLNLLLQQTSQRGLDLLREQDILIQPDIVTIQQISAAWLKEVG